MPLFPLLPMAQMFGAAKKLLLGTDGFVFGQVQTTVLAFDDTLLTRSVRLGRAVFLLALVIFEGVPEHGANHHQQYETG
jgi:hypothetical protein